MKRVPDDVRRFVLTSVPSVPYLEAALLFHARPKELISAAEAARALYVPERTAAELLESLCEAGLIAPAEERGQAKAYRYAPGDDALAQAVDRLALAYAQDLIAITNLIHDATQKSARRFAEAFKLRKDP
jgi:predicted ArsR family transcriptional regulator